MDRRDGTYNVIVRADGCRSRGESATARRARRAPRRVELTKALLFRARAHRQGRAGPAAGSRCDVVDRGDEVVRCAREGHRSSSARVCAGCGDDAACKLTPFADGDATVTPSRSARARGSARGSRDRGRSCLPVSSGLVTWKDGDFVLANDHIAIVIEDVGDSDLYDPWGGRPVGLARVQNGKMVEPNNFGELFFLTGRSTVVTESVTRDQRRQRRRPAIIRARGKLHPLPFFENLDLRRLQRRLGPTSRPRSTTSSRPARSRRCSHALRVAAREAEAIVPSTLHALMYTERTPVFQPGARASTTRCRTRRTSRSSTISATSWAYIPGEGELGSSLAARRASSARSRRASRCPACGTHRAAARADRDRRPRPRSGRESPPRATRGETLREMTRHGDARQGHARERPRPRDRRGGNVPDARGHRRGRRVHAARADRRRRHARRRTTAASAWSPCTSARRR